jgi:large subunit ribosomal protein L32e
MRRRYRGNKKMPKVGYGSDNRTKYYLPNGLKKFVVNNVKDLDILLMNNRTFCAEIAHNVSSKKRAAIVQRAQQIRVKVTNARGKVRTE